jgi:DHA1 family inner membrane transport protein
MAISLLSTLISATLPLLYNALLIRGQLTSTQIGLAATLELSATGVVAAIGMSRLPPTKLRLTVALAAVVFTLANLSTAQLPAAGIFVARALSGCASGIFMWLFVGMLARSTLPARLNGLFLALQGGAGMIVLAIFANIILPRFGPQGGFVGLAILSAAAVVASFWLPRAC